MVEEKQNRNKEILYLLQRKEEMTVEEIADMFNVSKMTARRDLIKLQEEGFVTRKQGLVFLSSSPYSDTYEIDKESNRNVRQKSRIGEKAASIIKTNETVFFDAGSTMPFVIRFIDKDMRFNAICYTLKNAIELYKRKNVKFSLAGGLYDRDSSDFYDTESSKFIRKFRTDKAIISAGGVHLNLGLTTSFHFEAEIKKAMIESSKQRILVTDSSKFGKISSIFFANLEEIDIIITDSEISDKYKKIIESKKIKLYIV